MALMVQLIHRDGITGVFEPGDAHPPLRVEFINGIAYVRESVFLSNQFQAYAAPRLADGEWALQPALPAIESAVKADDARREREAAKAAAPVKPKAAVKPRQPKATAKPKAEAIPQRPKPVKPRASK